MSFQGNCPENYVRSKYEKTMFCLVIFVWFSKSGLYKINKKGFIRNEFLLGQKPENKQDFDYFYEINGDIYISKVKHFLKNKSFLSDKTNTFEMKKNYSVDIDNNFDLKIAKFFFKSRF